MIRGRPPTTTANRPTSTAASSRAHPAASMVSISSWGASGSGDAAVIGSAFHHLRADARGEPPTAGVQEGSDAPAVVQAENLAEGEQVRRVQLDVPGRAGPVAE